MTRDELIARIKAHEGEIRAECVTHIALFGSRARGDVDVLFDYDPETKTPSWAGAGVYGIIKDATGLEVSLASRRGCGSDFAKRISRDLVPIF